VADDIADDQHGGIQGPLSHQVEVAADPLGDGGQERRGQFQAGTPRQLRGSQRIADRAQILQLVLRRLKMLTQHVRYASGPIVNSLFVTADASAVRALYPDHAQFQHLSDEARTVVSEPLGDLPGLWHEVPRAQRSSSNPATTIACRSGRRRLAETPSQP
jgi:hypothetical protein